MSLGSVPHAKDLAMPDLERLPHPMFRLSDNSLATIQKVDHEANQVTGTRTLRTGKTVKFTARISDWEAIEKTRVGNA